MENNIKRFTLRMNAKLFDIIKAQAHKNKRSVAMEIEYILEQYALTNNLIDLQSLDKNDLTK